ncbi:AMP-binding protein [Roseobacter sp. A03A-229]
MFFERSHLMQHADRTFCVLEDGTALSYRDLVEKTDAFQARLSAGQGLMLLRAAPLPETVIALLAALQSAVPVLLTAPDKPEEDAGLMDSFPFRYGYDPQTDALEVFEGGADVELHPDLALMLSTSGSTGAAKSIRLSHGNIASNAAAIADYLGLTPEDRAPTNLPPYYSYGLSVITSHLAAGASLMFTGRTVLEAEFWAAFDAQRCTSFAAVPHVIDMLEKSPHRTADRPALRYATQAGGKLAPARVAEIAARAQQEGWDFFVMYGQTEAAPRMAYLPPHEAATHPDCIGLPIPGGAFALIDADGTEITEPEVTGELVYRGPNVMMGYATGPADLARGPELDALHTGDMALRTAEGFYKIVGRKSRFIKPFGLRISLDEVDAWLSAQGHAALSGPGRGERLWLLVTPGEDAGALRQAVAGWLTIPASEISTVEVAELPLRANGKVDGRAVTEIIAAEDSAPATAQADWGDALFAQVRAGWQRLAGKTQDSGAPASGSIEAIFRSHFPGATITPDSSFDQLQGDSLRYLGVALDLEKELGHLPDNWDKTPLHALQGAPVHAGPTYIDTATFLRCLSIFFIISAHLKLVGYNGGGAMLLFSLAGYSFALYQIPAIQRTGSVISVWSQLARVAIPAMLYLTLLGQVFFPFDLRVVFLFSNWIDPQMHGNYAAWFIDVYVQLLLIMGLVFLLPPIRRAFAVDGFRAAVGFCVFSIALFSIAHEFWDTHHLFRRLPHMLLWLFALGMAAAYADRTSRKIIVTALACVALMLFTEKWLQNFLKWYFIGMMILLWVPRVEVSRWAASVIRRIAAASLFIYLTHFQWASVARIFFGENPYMPVLLALVGGIFCWHVYEWVQKQVLGVWSRWRGGTAEPDLTPKS